MTKVMTSERVTDTESSCNVAKCLTPRAGGLWIGDFRQEEMLFKYMQYNT